MASTKSKNVSFVYLLFIDTVFVGFFILHLLYFYTQTYPLSALPPYLATLLNPVFHVVLTSLLFATNLFLMNKLKANNKARKYQAILYFLIFLPVIFYDIVHMMYQDITTNSLLPFPWYINGLLFLVIEAAKILVAGIIFKMLLLKPLLKKTET